MDNPRGCIAVIVAVRESKLHRITGALTEASELGCSRVTLVFDKKAPSRNLALDAFNKEKATFESAGISLTSLEVDEQETTPRWRQAIIANFKDSATDWVFLFPSDFDMPLDTEQVRDRRRAWRAMVDRAAADSVELGDYNAKPGTFKDSFKELVGMPAVAAFFPVGEAEIRARLIRQLRTEFFIVGRRAFERLGEDFVLWTLDPTIDLTLVCLRHQDLSLHVEDLGDFADDDGGRRDPIGQLYQMARFIFGMAVNRIRIDRNRQPGAAEQLIVYDALTACLQQAFDGLMDSIRKNRATLAAESAAEAKERRDGPR